MTENFQKNFMQISGNVYDAQEIKSATLFIAGKSYFTFIKCMDVFLGIFRSVPLSEKISEIYQTWQKYFPEEFSPEEISPGELSRIC